MWYPYIEAEMVIFLMVSEQEQQRMRVSQVLTDMTDALQQAGFESPRVAAEWLLADVLGCRRLELPLRSNAGLSIEQQARIEAIRERVALREPIQYILGETEFMGLPIRCDRRALIPRPETEWWVDRVLQDPIWQEREVVRVLDVGTGTGCIALAIARFKETAQVRAIDLSTDALALAKENAAQLGLLQRIEFVQADLLTGEAARSADLVLANLPYISSEDCDALPDNVRNHEPLSALDGGVNGLAWIERLIGQATYVLASEGRIYLEIGEAQGACVLKCFQNTPFRNVEIHQDLSGRDRMVKAVLA